MRVGEVSLVLEMQKELPDVLFGDAVWAALRKVGELTDGSNVAIVSPLGLAGQVQVFGESLANFLGKVLSQWIGRTV